MNQYDFELAGGFPLELDIFKELQDSRNLLQSFGELAGNFSIIKGCITSGNRVSDGMLYYNGEVIPFIGDLVQNKVVVKETRIRKQFENGTEPVVLTQRVMCFGTGTTAIDWSLFKRPKNTLELTEAQNEKEEKTVVEQLANRINNVEARLAVFQEGGAMLFWNKPANQIPENWHEVEDWRGRMPVGFDPSQEEFDEIGKEGGSKYKELEEENIPEHDHVKNEAFNLFVGLAENIGESSPVSLDDGSSDRELAIGNLTPNLLEQMESQSVGEGEPFSVLNPYRTVLFIEYIEPQTV